MPWRDLVIMTPGVGRTSTNRSEGNRLFFRQLKRSCRRWQLKVLQLYLRGDLRLGMHSRFRNPRRSHVAPDECIRLSLGTNAGNTMACAGFLILICEN